MQRTPCARHVHAMCTPCPCSAGGCTSSSTETTPSSRLYVSVSIAPQKSSSSTYKLSLPPSITKRTSSPSRSTSNIWGTGAGLLLFLLNASGMSASSSIREAAERQAGR